MTAFRGRRKWIGSSRRIDGGTVGMADVHANGWFQRTTGQLAPGFRVSAGDTCLDVGCGGGGMSDFAAAMGAAVIATDIDPGANPQNDWPATADRCDLCLVSGPFTAAALRRGGATVPIRIVPVPTPAEYFTLPARTVAEPRKVACRGYVFPPSGDPAEDAIAPAAAPRTQRVGKAIELAFRRTLQATSGKPAYERLSRLTKGLKPARRRQPAGQTRAAAGRPLTPADFGVQSWPAAPLNRSNRHGTTNDPRPQGIRAGGPR